MAASSGRLSLLQRLGHVNTVSCLKNQISSKLIVRENSNFASITRVHRFAYPRTYPTVLVFPDGSTINIRYKEPRSIIKLPIDINSLSEAEKKRLASLRRPKQKLEVIEEFGDGVDLDKYSKFFKK